MRNTPKDPGSHQRLALKTMLPEESEEHMSGSTDLATVILNTSTPPPTPAVVGGLPVCIPMTRKNGTRVIQPFNGIEVGVESRPPDSDHGGARRFSGRVLAPLLYTHPSAPP